MNDIKALLPHIKLRFNMEHPSYEECYIFGYECAISNLGEEENPFRAGSKEAEQWVEGWWAGTFDDEPLFEMNTIDDEHLELNKEIAANDNQYGHKHNLLLLALEISGAIAASALVGYQLLELVA